MTQPVTQEVPSLYEVTGNITDFNTLLVSRQQYVEILQQQERLETLEQPVDITNK